MGFVFGREFYDAYFLSPSRYVDKNATILSGSLGYVNDFTQEHESTVCSIPDGIMVSNSMLPSENKSITGQRWVIGQSESVGGKLRLSAYSLEDCSRIQSFDFDMPFSEKDRPGLDCALLGSTRDQAGAFLKCTLPSWKNKYLFYLNIDEGTHRLLAEDSSSSFNQSPDKETFSVSTGYSPSPRTDFYRFTSAHSFSKIGTISEYLVDVAWSKDGHHIVATPYLKTFRLSDFSLIAQYRPSYSHPNAITTSPEDGENVIEFWGGDIKEYRLRNPLTYNIVTSIRIPEGYDYSSLATVRPGIMVFAGSKSSGKVPVTSIFSVKTGLLEKEISESLVAVSPDGTQLITYSKSSQGTPSMTVWKNK